MAHVRQSRPDSGLVRRGGGLHLLVADFEEESAAPPVALPFQLSGMAPGMEEAASIAMRSGWITEVIAICY